VNENGELTTLVSQNRLVALNMTNQLNLMIGLTEEEGALLAEVKLDPRAVKHGEPARQNGAKAADLAEMLLARGAIPEIRYAVFADDECAIGRGPSPLTVFRRKNSSRRDVLEHPHFLKWLRYFIFGPNLPATFLAAFYAKIEELGDITSGDYETLRHFIRPLVKRFDLIKSETDEVFKAALEFGLELDLADTLRREARMVSKDY